jgi:hypothetical protein
MMAIYSIMNLINGKKVKILAEGRLYSSFRLIIDYTKIRNIREEDKCRGTRQCDKVGYQERSQKQM